MEPVSTLFRKSIPNYFENLPIPDTFGGWFKLGFKDWLSLVPLGAAIGGLGYMSYKAFCPKAKIVFINPSIHKENAKHVDIIDIEDLKEKTALCRCWRSSKVVKKKKNKIALNVNDLLSDILFSFPFVMELITNSMRSQGIMWVLSALKESQNNRSTCYQIKLENNTNCHQCNCPQSKKSECSKYNGDKILERKQKESEEELENAKRTFRTTENVVRQSLSGMSGCHNQGKKNNEAVKKAIKPCHNHPTPPCKITGKEAIKKLARVPTSKECESKDKGRSNALDTSVAQNVTSLYTTGAQTKESKGLPKKPVLTSDQISQLIEQETNDVENAWIITSESKGTYKKPCPKQQKARDAVKALVEAKKEELLPCLAPPVIEESLPFLEPDPEDMSPEVAASMMYIQERGIKMISCPEDTVKHLFFGQFGSEDEEETEKKKGGGEPEVEEGEIVPAEVTDDNVDDSVFTRNMSQQREYGEDDRGNANVYDTAGKTYDRKREFFLQEKASKCVNKIQLRGNFAPWFPGYLAAFPDHISENAIQLAKSPSGVFQKAWIAAKPNNVPPADLYLVE